MRKSLLILLALSMSFYVMAQEKTKQKEIGLVFRNLDNFGLTFKTGTSKSLWRYNALFMSGSKMDEIADSLERKNSGMGFNVSIGREYRKMIANKLELRYGADLSFNYSHSEYDYTYNSNYGYDRYNKRTIYQPGINFVFGFNYVINEHFVIGAELLPHFRYRFGTSTEKGYGDANEIKSDISGFSYGLSNSSVVLSLVYRFTAIK